MDNKGRSNLAAVKQYLLCGTIPKDCNNTDKRAVRKRSKTFVIRDGQLYYTGGRPKRADAEEGEEETPENLENDTDRTQTLRKCCTNEEEKHEAVMSCHIGEDGTHFGMDKTGERVSSEYYWVGITNTVRKVIHSCDYCIARGIRCNTSALSHTHSNHTTPVVTVSNHENGIKMEVEMGEEPDVFFVSQETCSHFWQKVEIQVFGPYLAARKQVYVAVALDCYSQFPEAMVIENTSASSLTTFVLNLICRYGVMEKLCMLQNKCTKDMYLYINMQDLELAGIKLTFLSLHANVADERWQQVWKCLDDFVKAYPKMWERCLEAFMLPLRVSLPPQADYVPAYLNYNREPRLPETLSHKQDAASEVSLTDKDKKHTVDLLMSAYGQHAKNTNTNPHHLDLDLSLLPIVKLEALPHLDGDVLNLEESTIVPVNFEEEEQSERRKRRGRRRKEEEAETTNVEESNDAGDDFSDDDVVNDLNFSDFDEDDNDEPYQPKSNSRRKNHSSILTRSSSRKRTPTFKAKAEFLIKKEKRTPSASSPPSTEPIHPPKRKRGRPPKFRNEVEDPEGEEEGQASKSDSKEQLGAAPITTSGLMNSLELLDLDLYYLVIKAYKERGAYPQRVSVDFKRAVRRLADTVELKDGMLYGLVGKATGRLIVMRERERFALLRKAHAKGEEHMGRVRTLKTLLGMNVFWKGMSLDLDAFIHTCPECVMKNPLRNKTMVRIPTLSKEVAQKDHKADPHMSEDEEEECSYEDLMQYLTDETFPSTATPEHQEYIKQRSKWFSIMNGSLYYKSPARKNAVPRLVLLSETAQQEAIREAHIEEENHLSQQDTQVKLRRRYFWAGMTYDIMRHVMSCCMTEALAATPVEHRIPAIQQRVDRFRKYYKEGIPDMIVNADTTGTALSDAPEQGPSEAAAIDEDNTEVNKEAENPEIVEEMKESSATSAADTRAVREDKAIKRAMEAIIVKMGGETGEAWQKTSKAKMAASSASKPQGELTPDQIRIKKAKSKHKCEHCGKLVKGDVAFKVHLYKHTGIKPFSCSTCGKSFSNRKSLRIHNRKHTGHRPYLCNQCGREFFRSASLRYHLKAHATGRGTPVECDICGRKFTTQHRLIRHKEFKHPAQAKVFMCNQCGKHFTAARSLKRHEQTHTGIRKYQCQYCSKAFFRKEYLNSHLTNHAEYDPQVERLKPRKKPGKKPQEQQHAETVNVTTVVIPGPTGDTVPSNVIHWTESDQPATHSRHLEETTVTTLESYQHRQTVSTQPSHPAPSHVFTSARIAHLPVSSQSHTIHHTLHHPLAHTTRLVNVAGPHGPVSVTVSAAGQPIEVVHAGHGQEIMLQHEAVPVQYEVECLSGEASSLTEADLNAIHLLAQASITGQNLHTM
ncbi:uncharacterized protein [Littorina saxatilis]|uniref:C2H2-type domain-containing protein n=1 Tax=Littorina saxatilis TaxID=31220 RepID=A0AAN9BXU9_9CAEN